MFIRYRTHTWPNSFCFHCKKSDFIGNSKIINVFHKPKSVIRDFFAQNIRL